MSPTDRLAADIDALLPQTQCTRCGEPDCGSYARAVASGAAAINRCPPGGVEGMRRLARLTGRPELPLDPACGAEGPRRLAVIDEDWCIGCTLCLKACPVDAIFGASKQMHVIVEAQCTGCELCVPACPVDCISMADTSDPATGWQAWSPAQAAEARRRYQFHRLRLERERQENETRLAAKAEHKLAHLASETRLTDPAQIERKRAVIEAALARARERRRQDAP